MTCCVKIVSGPSRPFLWFVESSFSFTHNEGDAPTMQATMGHNALFARQVHIEVDLFAWPIVGSSLLLHRGELEEDQSITEHDGSLRNFYNNVTINVYPMRQQSRNLLHCHGLSMKLFQVILIWRPITSSILT
ncbi:hypothetical protein MTR67_007423 [Solanum verrucosum]|uniref:Uncharacterized protein n=1 Tax=Solanum verrucosum TaxID=315347 RepID=A0AAF0PZS7_SOLVR|nr:hypothetical protein MTR67_007423 [Solanum verrucosum]